MDGKDQIIVVPNLNKGKVKTPVQQITVIESGGRFGTPITLGPPLSGAKAAACDTAGNLYVLADTNQLHNSILRGNCWRLSEGGLSYDLKMAAS